ncbi:MAG TPA: helix-turn-helix domain-containing protein [Kribbella sp.]
MQSVVRWTGAEARALRLALRFSVRGFAEHLGVAVRTVSKWEAEGGRRQPRPDMQAALDTVLSNASPVARARFAETLESKRTAVSAAPALVRWDNEAWTDDLDRARSYAARQNFVLATRLIERWLGRADGTRLDERGVYLRGRSLVLLGDVQRDQGHLGGPGSASAAYADAHRVFSGLGGTTRVGQIELLLTVVSEMAGQIEESALRYRGLADDVRLSPLDRARARLWIGTALSKSRMFDQDTFDAAISAIGSAIREFESLDEPDEWSVAHQKLALAHLAAGRPDVAHRQMDVAVSTARDDSPLQRVKLTTARAHILLNDRATRDDGLRLLASTRAEALKHRLVHQAASIDRISKLADGNRNLARAK